jgi:membrane-associated protease RseP (regulator of RpoE activity)
LGVVVGIAGSLTGYYLLVSTTIALQRAFGIILPTVGTFRYPAPVISVPLWYWLVGIFVVIAAHEIMHAVFSRLEIVRIKNFGVLLLFLLPIGAFVDPDLRQLRRRPLINRLRVFAAGSLGNFAVAALVLLLTQASTGVTSWLIEDVGLRFGATIPGTPAHTVGLNGTIIQIDGHRIRNRADFFRVMERVRPGDNLTIQTTVGIYSLRTTEHPEVEGRPFIGIRGVAEVYRYRVISTELVPNWVIGSLSVWFGLLFWLFLLNLGVALVNLWPVLGLDGGHMWEGLIERVAPGWGKLAIRATTALTLGLLAANLALA